MDHEQHLFWLQSKRMDATNILALMPPFLNQCLSLLVNFVNLEYLT